MLFSTYTSTKERGKQVSLQEMILIPTAALSPIVAGLIIETFGFAFLAILASLLLMSSLFLLSKIDNIKFDLDLRLNLDRLKQKSVSQVLRLDFLNELMMRADVVWGLILFLGLSSSYSQIGLLFSLSIVVSIALAYLFGRLLDRYQRHRILKIMALIFSATVALRLTANKFWQLLATDTLSKLSRKIYLQSSEVVILDELTATKDVSLYDEANFLREIFSAVFVSISYFVMVALSIFLGLEMAMLVLAGFGLVVLFFDI